MYLSCLSQDGCNPTDLFLCHLSTLYPNIKMQFIHLTS
jgi:hypothetical protein